MHLAKRALIFFLGIDRRDHSCKAKEYDVRFCRSAAKVKAVKLSSNSTVAASGWKAVKEH